MKCHYCNVVKNVISKITSHINSYYYVWLMLTLTLNPSHPVLDYSSRYWIVLTCLNKKYMVLITKLCIWCLVLKYLLLNTSHLTFKSKWIHLMCSFTVQYVHSIGVWPRACTPLLDCECNYLWQVFFSILNDVPPHPRSGLRKKLASIDAWSSVVDVNKWLGVMCEDRCIWHGAGLKSTCK